MNTPEPAVDLRLPTFTAPSFSLRGRSVPPAPRAPQPAHRPARHARPAAQPRSAYARAFAHGAAVASHALRHPHAAPPQQAPTAAYATPAPTVTAHVQQAVAVAPRPTPAWPAATQTLTYGAAGADEARFSISHFQIAMLASLIAIVWIITSGSGQSSFRDAQSIAAMRGQAPATAAAGPGPATFRETGAKTLPMTAETPVLPMKGMPSPAAAESIARQRAGMGARTLPLAADRPIQMKGMPSPAAAATFAPKILPLLADSDGVTLPSMRVPEAGDTVVRDDHSRDRHYMPPRRSSGIDVSTPLVTPGQSSIASEPGGLGPYAASDPYALDYGSM